MRNFFPPNKLVFWLRDFPLVIDNNLNKGEGKKTHKLLHKYNPTSPDPNKLLRNLDNVMKLIQVTY
jgi:hypothetical protein